MAPTTRFAEIVAARGAERHRLAERLAARCLATIGALGHRAALIGSLATGRFRLHSDIDILVESPVDPIGRAEVERALAGILRGAGISYDLIFACDLTQEQREAFEHDRIIASRLREARPEA
jgi:predicted nucleotidyltransferase